MSVVTKLRKYAESNGSFRCVPVKHCFGDSSRSSLPDVLANSYQDITICPCWSQFFHLSVEDFGKGSDVIILCVRSMFVSHSTE